MYLPPILPQIAADVCADVADWNAGQGSPVLWKGSEAVPESWEFEYGHGYRHAVMVTYRSTRPDGRYQADYGVTEDLRVSLWAN